MKLKRAKAYKKLLHQYELNFGFREPYQVLLDSSVLQDAYKFKIDLVGRLEKVLGAKVKPMITQCDMRHLYDAKPKNETLILQAKEYERRRCGHHELEEPLSTLECLTSVVDPKGSGSNKHRYVVASNEKEVRAKMRRIPGVPLIYISKSVVLMEPMTSATEEHREREEKSKFKLGLKGARKPDAGEKRKREDEDEKDDKSIATEAQVAKKKRKGPKQPNPLSMKKKKADPAKQQQGSEKKPEPAEPVQPSTTDAQDGEAPAPKKRRRKHKSKAEGGATEDGGVTLEAGEAASP